MLNLGRFSEEEDLSNAMVAVQRQSFTKTHHIRGLRAHKPDCGSIKRKVSSIHESETRRAGEIRGVLETESLCRWYVRFTERI